MLWHFLGSVGYAAGVAQAFDARVHHSLKSEPPVKKILLIDDDEDILIELEELMVQLGFSCLCAHNASEALAALDQHADIKLIISDLRMPDQSGLRLLQILAEHNEGKDSVPVIITSGHADMDDVITLFRNGAVDFLPKPIHYDHLVSVLQKLFPERPMS
ncbi:histidine kinase [Pseudomonas sp. MYb185]|nr:histidine kinase [Pseudomonas sp. MYb185]